MPTSELLGTSEPPKNPHIERKKRINKLKRRLYVSEKERKRSNEKKADPVKKRARNMVAAAILRGDLKPRPCSWRDKVSRKWCNKTPTEAHHKSYEPGRELDVRWLCKQHHDLLSSAEWKRAFKAKRVASSAYPKPS